MGAGASAVASGDAAAGAAGAAVKSFLPAGVEHFDAAKAKEIVGDAFDLSKFQAIASQAGTIPKQVMADATSDFSALCSIPKDVPSFSLDEAKSIVGKYPCRWRPQG